MKKIAIIGAGSCGTALAVALAHSREPHRLSLWVHGPDVLESLRAKRENSIYLPGIRIPDPIEVTGEMSEALAGAEMILGAMPSAHARSVYSAMRPHILPPQGRPGPIFVSATKGLEPDSFARMTQVISQVLPQKPAPRLAVLSGPSFARELARGDPTAVVIASQDPAVAAAVQEEFSGPFLRLYTNDDVTGVELGGALKNIIALGAGIGDGLGMGDNAKSAFITSGLAEITRLGIAAGANPLTLAGLAGLGDLIATCASPLSRNHYVGVQLAQGRSWPEIRESMENVAEGVNTTVAALKLATGLGVEMPIAQATHRVLFDGLSPKEAVAELMGRPPRSEW